MIKLPELKLMQKIVDEIWSTYDDAHGYATEKRAINNEVDLSDPYSINFLIGQFDTNNIYRAIILLVRKHKKEQGFDKLMDLLRERFFLEIRASRRIKIRGEIKKKAVHRAKSSSIKND